MLHLQDVTVRCNPDDIGHFRTSEQEFLRLVIPGPADAGDGGWTYILLQRESLTEWRSPGAALNQQYAPGYPVFVLLSESHNGVGHTEILDLKSQDLGTYQAEVNAERDALRLSLCFEVVERESSGNQPTPLSQDASLEIVEGCAYYLDRRSSRAGSQSPTLLRLSVNVWDYASGIAERSHSNKDLAAEYGRNAVSTLRKLVASSESKRPDVLLLDEIARRLDTLFLSTGNASDLDAAIEARRRAATEDSTARRLHDLAASLSRKHQLTGSLECLEEAFVASMESVSLTPREDECFGWRSYQLGDIFDSKYRFSGSLEDLDRAIELFESVNSLSATSKNTARHINLLVDLGNSLRRRFGESKMMEDVHRSINAYTSAADICRSKDPLKLPWVLNLLGVALDFCFYQSSNGDHIEKSILVLQEAVERSTEEDGSVAERLYNLGVSLYSRFGCTDSLDDLQAAIAAHQKAVKATASDSTALGVRLAELARMLEKRASLTGERFDVQEVIETKKREINNLPTGHPDLPHAYHSLALLYEKEFERSKEIDSIIAAVASHEKSIDTAPVGYSTIPAWLNTLGNAQQRKYTKTKDLDDLRCAIRAKRKSVEATPANHAHMPIRLNNLGRSLSMHFQETGELSSIDEAIEVCQRATSLVTEDHGGLPEWVKQLAKSYKIRFDKTEDIADLDCAIASQRKVLHLRPIGSPDVPGEECTLANFLVARFEKSDNDVDLRDAVSHLRSAAMADVGPPAIRLSAAQRWAEYSKTFNVNNSLEAYDRAIELISVYVTLEQTQTRRHENIAKISDLSRSAAAIALEAGRVDQALEWLESGRGLIWAQFNTLRAPLDELRAVNEELAGQLLGVSQALEISGSQAGSNIVGLKDVVATSGGASEVAGNVDLALERKKLIATVREIPGFEHFLRPEGIRTMLAGLPTSGAVVVINVHADRCDAVAIKTGHELIHIPLPLFSLDQAEKMRGHLREQMLLGGVRARGYEMEGMTDGERAVRKRVRKNQHEYGLREILRELWTGVVRPILEGLEYTQKNEALSNRLWWCATGPLAFLPIHAAGEYKEGGDCVGDYVTSSYIPSVSMLSRRGKTMPRESDAPSKGVYLVSQPKTPGQTPLPGTTKEVEVVQGILEERGVEYKRSDGPDATRETCTKAMTEYSVVHLACHAVQDALEPLNSGFFLQDGRLKLSTLMRNDLTGAKLAFLSACQTSTGDEELSEEAVHLAAGLLATGYCGVIATMWSIQDQHAPFIAREFYIELLRGNELGMAEDLEETRAAAALGVATGRLRKMLGDTEDALMVWVPYVHFGR